MNNYNEKLLELCKDSNTDIEMSVIYNNYKWFDSHNINKSYNLNIIGVRANIKNNEVTNSFDDVLILEYIDGRKHLTRKVYPITTEPGKYYMNHPLAKKGTAILVEGQYKGCWAIGKHKGIYDALVQVKPVKVYRDNNKDNKYDLDPENIEKGLYGLNIHRSNPNKNSIFIDKWSAGCQVFANYKDFNEFMSLCRKSAAIYGNSFTYTLLKEEQLWK